MAEVKQVSFANKESDLDLLYRIEICRKCSDISFSGFMKNAAREKLNRIEQSDCYNSVSNSYHSGSNETVGATHIKLNNNSAISESALDNMLSMFQ